MDKEIKRATEELTPHQIFWLSFVWLERKFKREGNKEAQKSCKTIISHYFKSQLDTIGRDDLKLKEDK